MTSTVVVSSPADEVAELRASRARILAAADADRRLIERRIHDGVVQDLIALGVNLQLAGRLAGSDTQGAVNLLEEMGRHVHDALDDVRDLAWRVYPSLLLGGGLTDALRAHTRVSSVDLGRCAPEIEAAIYFSCVELLEHAAGTATVQLRRDGELIAFELTVEDADRAGWRDADLTSVRDRLEAFGGSLTVEDAKRGVRVSGTVQARVPETSATSAR